VLQKVSGALFLFYIFEIFFLSRYQIAGEVIAFFSYPSPFSTNMALGLTQPLTEINTGNLPPGKGRPTHKADDLAVVCEPIV
jgi:hypothetical protein